MKAKASLTGKSYIKKLKRYKKFSRPAREIRKKRAASSVPYMNRKMEFFSRHENLNDRKKFLVYNMSKRIPHLKMKLRLHRIIRFLVKLKLPKVLSFIRWVIVDFLRVKPPEFWGIYCYVALPGEGKTMSMINHINTVKKRNPDVLVATNCGYRYQDIPINDWTDIVKFSRYCESHHRPFIIALDEIHCLFDASDWKSFPQVLQVILSQNRHLNMQFLCTAQRYDRIPTKVKAIANYIVICKNILKLDRFFMNYYFPQQDYEDRFSGKRKKAEYICTYVADDSLYHCYNTKEMVDMLVDSEIVEKKKREESLQSYYTVDFSSEYDGLINLEHRV